VTAPVFLDQLIDALEAQSELHIAYLDRETGEIHLISRGCNLIGKVKQM
jgi:hypothetical protein